MSPSGSPVSWGAVVFVNDASRAAAFYRAITGLPVAHSEEGYVLLGDGAYQLVIHAIPAPIAATIEVTSPPALREDAAFKLFFMVPDLAKARRAAAEHGGAIDPPDREWRLREYRVAEGHDPEGNVIQLRQVTTELS